MKTDQNKAGLATLLSDKIDCKKATLMMGGFLSVIIGSIHQENPTIMNIQGSNTIVSIHKKQKLIDCRKKTNRFTIILGNSGPLLPINSG